jgi:hypothetical protein
MLRSMGVEGWTEGIEVTRSISAWVFPEASVIFTKSHGRRASTDDANALIDLFLWLQRELPPAARPPAIVHDWRSMTELPIAVRRVFVARRREIEIAPRRIVVAIGINPVLRMIVQAVTLSAQLLTRAAPFELVDRPAAALVELGVGLPDVALHERLRFAWRAKRRSVRPPPAPSSNSL